MTIFVVGLAVGLLSTIFGLGGGIIMVPVLTAVADLSHVEAMATSLATIVIISLWNAWRYSQEGLVVWRVVLWVSLGSGICAALAAQTAPLLPEKALVGFMLMVLLILAWKTFRLGSTNEKERKTPGHQTALGIGSLSGLVAGFTGIGGGGVTTPLMLTAGLVKNQNAAPISNAIMISTAGAGALSYALNGVFDWPRLGLIRTDYTLLLALGAIISSFAGIRINHLIKLKLRKTILGFILLIIALRLSFQIFT
ncbi:MAG: sulfite exporter TauE/SafE family protein [Deltaproteobacteria bacterium]|nr:sulfite exporter TauE/SafE family protein [Deltaproteobacteria bacterium]